MEQLQRLSVVCEKVELVTQRLYFFHDTQKKQGRLKPFIEFMQKDDSEEVTRLFSLKKLPSFFGPENFLVRKIS